MESFDKIIDNVLDDVVKKTIKLCYEYIEDIFNDNLNNEEQVHEIKTTFEDLINYKNNDLFEPEINKIKSDARQKVQDDYISIISGDIDYDLEEISNNIKNLQKNLLNIF